jgi:2-oxoglutarate dehydrogenase E2 component (dihydrolipoamide succinyltransferase)
MTADGTLADVVMPRMGVSVAEGTVGIWLKAVGDSVVVDEPLLEVSTDKVDTEIPSPVGGILAEILVPEGEVVPVGAPLARVRLPEAARPAAAQAGSARRASSSVVRLAQQFGVDLSAVTATGPGQRVTREDLLLHVQRLALRPPSTHSEAQPAALTSPLTSRPATPAALPASPEALGDGEHATPMSAMRREIAQRMRHSVDTAVHVTSLVEVDMSSVIAARTRQQPSSGPQSRPTLLAYVARAVVATLPKTPWLNGQIRGDSIIAVDQINLGIAVSTDDGKGLMVPVIRNAADLNLSGLAAHIAELAERARSRALSVSDLSGATFTVTNLGGFGTFAGTPIINPPQAAILGMYAMVKRPVVVPDADGNDAIGIRPMMNLSMSYDHRLIDGATAGAFLNGVRAFLENWNDRTHR